MKKVALGFLLSGAALVAGESHWVPIESVEALGERFDADAGKLRLVLLLSPT